MNVAVFCDSYRLGLGGLTNAVIQQAQGLARAGHRVTVYTLPQRGPAPGGPVEVVPVRALALPEWAGFPPQTMIATGFQEILEQVRGLRPDVIHLHTVYPVSWIGLGCARRLGIPAVATYHAYLPAAAEWIPRHPPVVRRQVLRLINAATRCFYNRCERVIAPSQGIRRMLREAGVTRPVAVISNGVDLSRFCPAPAPRERAKPAGEDGASVVVLYVGRLSAEKQVSVLLRALASLSPCGIRIRMVIAGDGPLAAALRREAAALGVADRVEFRGFVDPAALPSVYARADIFGFPSPSETQGLALLEAMAAGLPVVAAESLAAPDLVRHGWNGYLFPAGDAAGMAGALARLAADPALRLQMGRRGRAIAAKHSQARTLARLEDLYRELTMNDPARRDGPTSPRGAE